MDSDSWSRLSATSRRIQPRYDAYLGFEEIDDVAEEEPRTEYSCPFCSEDFDIIGLCIHIDDEHPVEAKNGICPICHVRFGIDMVAHITMEHASFFKMHRRRKFRKLPSGTQSAISFFRKELREGNLQSFHGGSSFTVPPSSAAPDPLLSSFINLSVANSLKDVQSESSGEGAMVINTSDEKVVESVEPSLSDKDQKERARRSEFVQGLLMSTIFDDTL